MHSSCGVFLSSLLLCIGVGACSSSSPSDGPGNSAAGAASTSGGASAAGNPDQVPNGGALGSAGSPATAGASTTAAGASSGDGNPDGSAGAPGSVSAGGSTQSGGSSSSAGRGNAAGGSSVGGSTGGAGAPASGGAGPKPDPSTLPAITVHMAGDSTMSNYAASTTQEGWGQEFGQFFNSKVTIDNQALGGANVQTFYTGKWKTLINNTKAGDYVFAAFGINDSGTTHGPVSPPDFQAQLSTMADEVAAKKATFILTTSTPLQVWTGGKETNARLQPYVDVTIALGKIKNLLVDDLNARGIEYYDMIGQSAAAALTFNGDKAHFDKAGATAMAQLAAKELTRINSPLAAYLK